MVIYSYTKTGKCFSVYFEDNIKVKCGKKSFRHYALGIKLF